MTYEEAKEMYEDNHSHDGKFPYGEECKKESFVVHEVPLPLLRQRGVETSYIDLMQKIEMDPIWIKTCKRGRPYWDNLFSVVDGNHRVASAVALGRTHIKAAMPESHYYFWRNLNVESS